jgi:DNA-binding CsgD family transcriptional regulator
MAPIRIIYWALSYTAGIVCLTLFLLRYLQSRSRPDLKIILFLLAFGLSIASLCLLEGYWERPGTSGLAGLLALCGAGLIVITFPDYALSMDPTTYRRRMNLFFRVAGICLLALNLVAAALFTALWPWVQLVTFICLALAIFFGMTWISRSSPRWEATASPFMMTSLFIFFALVMVLDFLRPFLPLPRAFTLYAGNRYLLFPAFYAYLNVVLFYSHVKVWAKGFAAAGELRAATSERLAAFGVSEREAEVLAHVARGHTYREIADSLCVSLATIKSHVSHLYEKTDTRNKVELINLLYDSGRGAKNQPLGQ